MNTNKWKLLAGVLALTGVIAFSSMGNNETSDLLAAQRMEQPSMNGKQAPEFTLKNLKGETVSLEDFEGKVVLLNFWATWCPPCRVEIPDFVELMEEKDTSQFAIVGITIQSGSVEQIQQFANNMEINYPLLHGDNNVIMGLAKQYGNVRTIPTSFLIDKDGTIQKTYNGARSAEVFWEDISAHI
jgi:cytochrome c biogenesis protein CcmG/thiol:disulfide interchange protein DsbE